MLGAWKVTEGPLPTARLGLPGDPRGNRIILVVQPGDCDGDLERLAWWGVVAASYGIEIAGVVVGEAAGEAEAAISSIRRHGRLAFPLHRDERGRAVRFVRSLGYRSTPLALGFDSGSRLRFAAPLRSVPDPAAAIEVIHSSLEEVIP